MRDSWQEHEEFKDSLSLAVLILLFIFAVELFTMDLFTPLFARVGWGVGSLIDAGIITALSAPLLWFLLKRLPARARSAATSRRLLLSQALCGIFFTELLVMLLEPMLFPGAEAKWLNLADAVLTSLVSAVPLWWLLFRRQSDAGAASIAKELHTPLRLFALLLGSVFLVDLLQECILPPHSFGASSGFNRVLDACVTALFSAPLLWVVVGRPLKRAARSGRVRATALYAQVVDAIVVLDRSGTVTSCNPAAERIFGLTSAQMRGRSGAILLLEGEEGLRQLLEGAAGLGDGESLSREILCRRRDSSPATMDVSLSEVLVEEEQEYLLLMRDITSRKKMEEALRESETRFRQIFEQAEDAIVFFRAGSAEILEVNKRGEKLLGYATSELQEGGLALICPAEWSAICQEISAIGEGKPVRRDRIAGRRKDGRDIILSLRAKIMVLHGAPVTYCTLRDITERVRTEEREHQIRTKLIQANKMTSLGLLVSGVAHEINNPNNYVTVSARLLERIWHDALAVLREYHEDNGDFCLGGVQYADLEPRSAELLEGIIDGSRRIDEIIGNLKRFARQELAAPEEVDLNAVARSAVSLMRHELIKFTDRFEMELAPDSVPVRGSRQQLGQVVINLLMNACQALPDKERGIRLATSFDRSSDEMVITVRDEGRGFSQEEGGRILEPFFSTKLDEGGTGLGLAICDSIVREHHGSLHFVSAPGEGTTFTVSIPAGTLPGPAEHP